MLMATQMAWDVQLDVAGRWLLTTIDYRHWAILIAVVVVAFGVWRRYHYQSWPSRDDYFSLLFSLIGLIGGVTAWAVFILTKPPAVDMLSGPLLLLLGLGVPILVFGESFPKLRDLFFPVAAPKPPANPVTDTTREQSKGTVNPAGKNESQ